MPERHSTRQHKSVPHCICQQKPNRCRAQVQQHRKGGPRYSTWAQESSPLLFSREVLIITNHKPLVAIFKKDVATLTQCIQCILLKIHQYRVQIIYKPGPEIFIADWLSQHNHKEGKDKPIKNMDITIDAIQSTKDILECISISQIQQALAQDKHLQHIKNIIITAWLSTKDELHRNLRPYWTYRDGLAVIDGVAMKGRCIIIPVILK